MAYFYPLLSQVKKKIDWNKNNSDIRVVESHDKIIWVVILLLLSLCSIIWAVFPVQFHHSCYLLLSHFSFVWLFGTTWTIAHQAPLSMGFSYWSGLPLLSPGDLPDQRWNPGLPHCRQNLYHLSHQGIPSIDLILKSYYNRTITAI